MVGDPDSGLSYSIGIPLGLVTANAVEWLVHRHLLHGWGRTSVAAGCG